MNGYNIVKSYLQKPTKNHSRKKQENKDNLAGPFWAILTFGSKLMLLFRVF